MKIREEFALLLHKCKFPAFYLTFFAVIILIVPVSYVSVKDQPGAVFYVSPDGNDSSPGTREQPMATPEAAIDVARKNGTGNCRIILISGEYFLDSPLEIDSRDNGLTIEAEQTGKVLLHGGSLVTGWYRDGNKLWCADLQGVKEGKWVFRALVVNGRMAERARFPDTATFFHRQIWDVKVLPAIAGYWERQPLPEELITMAYDPKDIPGNLDIKNAELRIYHMWDESLVGIAHNDKQRHIFTFSSPAIYPPGAFGIKKYVILNTREGMTRPGRWYLDRSAGRIVYWPLEDEDMDKARVIAPKIEQIFKISGDLEKKVERITIRDLSFQVTNIPLKSAGFGAASFNGALNIKFANECTFENLEIFNTGGLGILAQQLTDCKIVNCNIHHTGGCGLKVDGSNLLVSGNHIHNTGIYYPSAAALYANGEGMHIYRNVIHNIPYSGVIIGGPDHLIEENQISQVMQQLHDGAAIYVSGMDAKNVVLRGNFVHDISAVGEGYGVSSYYFDEGASKGIVERNVSIDVGRPTHNHIASDITYRDNVFINNGVMTLSFQRSADCIFEYNTLVASGRINITQPNAIKLWKDNIIYQSENTIDEVKQNFSIDSAMPSYSVPELRTQSIKVERISKPPEMDGDIESAEYSGEFYTLDREPSRLPASGAPVLVKLSYDNKFLYLGTIISMFDPMNISKGNIWEKHDGLEISVAGKSAKGDPVNYKIRLYADGTIQSLTNAGLKAESEHLRKKVLFITKIQQKKRHGGGWNCELAIPFSALGLKPEPGAKVAFNLCAYCNEYGRWHCWEGIHSGNNSLDVTGKFQLQ
jgi:hypothetical protein